MRRTNPTPLKEVLKEYVKALKMQTKLSEVGLINSWEKLVPPTISKATKDIYIKDRKLFLRLNSSVIRNELMLIKSGLISKLNEQSGKETIIDIVFL